MTTQRYPNTPEATVENLKDFCEEIARIRDEDITDFDNLQNRFINGRKTGKIPLTSNDIVGDKVGDFNYDAAYIYICVNNGGTAQWRRVATGSF